MIEAVIFYPTAFALLILALLSVFTEKIVNSLVAGIAVFFLTALIFYLLGAEYNAVMQLSVYGLAVPILLAIALMFTNTRNEKGSSTLGVRRYLVYCAISLIILGVVYLIAVSLNITQGETFASKMTELNSYRVFDAIVEGFFGPYLVAFELVSVLLYAVVVGVSDNAK